MHSQVGSKNPNWKGGKKQISKDGHVIVYALNHPNSHYNRVLEHVFVMSKILGRGLEKEEIVHHKNGIRDDNRPENLELWTKHHPSGQVKDLLSWARQFILKYDDEKEIQ